MLKVNFTEKESAYIEKVMEILGCLDIDPEFTVIGDHLEMCKITVNYKVPNSDWYFIKCAYYPTTGGAFVDGYSLGNKPKPSFRKEFDGKKTPEELAELILELAKDKAA